MSQMANQASSSSIPSSADLQSWMDRLSSLITFIFSWIILLAVGVIVSGIFFAKVFPIKGFTGGTFKIPLFIFNLEAHDDEVVLGLTSFLTTLLICALLGGASLYHFTVERFGIDPGQFHMLCFVSALINALLSCTVWILFSVLRSNTQDRAKAEAQAVILKLKNRSGQGQAP
jgi:hypothetical protein